ncbi:MAG: PilW family protein [Desulfamplus sp.]|nr:PilW family protein [Desulfamplus sp.]
MYNLKRTPFLRNKPKGFTLIEIMISLVISIILIGATYQVFINQNKSYIIQEEIVEMQQTLRGALVILERDIRLAGYDPQEANKDNPNTYAITTATDISFGFTADINENGDSPAANIPSPGETEIFLYELYDPVVYQGSTVYSLTRTPPPPLGVRRAIGMNIEDLRFAYSYDADTNGNIDRSAGNNIIWAYPNLGTNTWFSIDDNDDGVIDQADTPGGVDTGTPFNLADIRAVRVWILVRADKPDSDYINSTTYVVGSNHFTPPANDHFRRVLLDITVKCRNMGM